MYATQGLLTLAAFAELGGANVRGQRPGCSAAVLASTVSSGHQHPERDDAILCARPEGCCQHSTGEGSQEAAAGTSSGCRVLFAPRLAAGAANLSARRVTGTLLWLFLLLLLLMVNDLFEANTGAT